MLAEIDTEGDPNMSTEGVEGVHLETRSWDKTAKFLEALGYQVEFASGHGSGVLKHATGPYFFVREVTGEPEIQLVLRVADAGAFEPDVDVVSPFEETHYGTRRMLVRDPDGRTWGIEAPLGN